MTLFEITTDDIESLSDTDLRELVGRLCEQETELQGHSRSTVTFGGDQRAKDVRAAGIETVPTETFHHLSRVTETFSGADLRRVLSTLLVRPDGGELALQIMGSRVHDIKLGRAKLSAEDMAMGQEILAREAFQGNKNRDGYQLAQIAKCCLTAPDDSALVESICVKLYTSIENFDVYAWNFADFLKALAKRFPRVVLDVFVARAHGSESRRDVFSSFREHRPDPLDQIDEQSFIDWAQEDAEARFPALADVIRPWRKADGEPDENEAAPLVWTTIALRLVEDSPSPLQVLSAFYRRLEPMSWSGSRAALMQARLPLLGQLGNHERTEIAEWARNAVVTFAQRVSQEREWERMRSREDDERFEH